MDKGIIEYVFKYLDNRYMNKGVINFNQENPIVRVVMLFGVNHGIFHEWFSNKLSDGNKMTSDDVLGNYKVGSRLKIVKLRSWMSTLCERCPVRDIPIPSEGVIKELGLYYDGVDKGLKDFYLLVGRVEVNGVDYGFTFTGGYGNYYEVIK